MINSEAMSLTGSEGEGNEHHIKQRSLYMVD